MADDQDTRLGAALVEEATRKAGLVWLAYEPDGEEPRPARHAWHEGALVLVVGGTELHLPGLATAARAVVTVPSKDTKAGVVTWVGSVTVVDPADDTWLGAARAYAAGRLNGEGGQAMLDRWARESVVLLVRPTGELLERGDDPDARSRAAQPRATGATTLGRQPRMLGGLRRRR